MCLCIVWVASTHRLLYTVNNHRHGKGCAGYPVTVVPVYQLYIIPRPLVDVNSKPYHVRPHINPTQSQYCKNQCYTLGIISPPTQMYIIIYHFVRTCETCTSKSWLNVFYFCSPPILKSVTFTDSIENECSSGSYLDLDIQWHTSQPQQ